MTKKHLKPFEIWKISMKLSNTQVKEYLQQIEAEAKSEGLIWGILAGIAIVILNIIILNYFGIHF